MFKKLSKGIQAGQAAALARQRGRQEARKDRADARQAARKERIDNRRKAIGSVFKKVESGIQSVGKKIEGAAKAGFNFYRIVIFGGLAIVGTIVLIPLLRPDVATAAISGGLQIAKIATPMGRAASMAGA